MQVYIASDASLIHDEDGLKEAIMHRLNSGGEMSEREIGMIVHVTDAMGDADECCDSGECVSTMTIALQSTISEDDALESLTLAMVEGGAIDSRIRILSWD